MKKYIGLIITGLLPLVMQAQFVMSNNDYVVLSGGSAATPTKLVISDPATTGIVNTGTGWIISENEFNVVQWNIGTNTGTYVVPFGDSTANYLPLTLNINAAGTGNGVVQFSTWNTVADNWTGVTSVTGPPSDVTNVNPFILPGSPSNSDDSYNLVDRFYVIDANTGYTTKPAAGNITFSYISGGVDNEVAAPNTLTQSNLMAERFNSGSSTWSDWFGYGCTDAIVGNVGTVQTGPVSAVDMYRSWALWDNLTPLPLTLVSTNISCGGSSTGSASVTVYGGVQAYTYSWAPSGGSSATASGLSAGNYTVTVTDNHGCASTASITITQPPVLSITIASETNVFCNGGSTGSATANAATGGTGAYTYSWAPSGGTNLNASGLSAGSYTITVTDNNGCTASASTTISQPAQLRDSLASSVNPSLCNVNGGSATIGVKGGTGAYTWTWTPNVSTTATATGLSARSYTVALQDNNGCVAANVTFTLTNSPGLRDSIVSFQSLLCKSVNNGDITVGVKGGSAPYTYTWTPNVSTTNNAFNLSAGTYTITIKDATGCAGTILTETLTQPANRLIDSISVHVDVGCHNGTSGEISVGTRGGIPPYTYQWSDGNTNYTQSNLTIGTYTMTVTDHNGCSNTLSATLTQPAADLVETLTSHSNVTCYGTKTGSASVSATGGTTPYTYTWSPNVSTTSSCSTLTAGTYTITTHDAHGCNSMVTVTITQPVQIRDSMVAVSKVQITCNGANNGSYTIGAKYGTPPYTYLWTPGGQTTATATGLSAGTYSVTVTDINGCTGTVATCTFTQPAALRDSLAKESCISNKITATIGTKGGTAPYTYYWTPGGGTKASLSGLTPGTYTISITDAHGCSQTLTPNLQCGGNPPPHSPEDDNTSDGIQCCSGQYNISLYPNPNTGQFTLTGLEKGMIIEMYDYTGRMMRTVSASDITMQLDISTQPNGVYLIRILDSSGTLLSQNKVVKTQ